MYGLNDASRKWFKNVEAELKKLGCTQSKLDPAVFTYCSGGQLNGVILLHVDDFLHIGVWCFQQHVICNIRKVFQAGKTQQGDFRYIGLDINQHRAYNYFISISQQHYIDELATVPITALR